MRYLALAALAALVVAAGATAALQKGSTTLHATLVGKVEVPKGDLDGAGTAEIKITGRKVCWEVKTTRIGKIMAGHIHKGGPGVAGPVVVPFGAVFHNEGCTTTAAALAAAILRNPGRYYVNVHTARYPAGALRGQLRADR
jgi:hypothetical protein